MSNAQDRWADRHYASNRLDVDAERIKLLVERAKRLETARDRSAI